jgi:23S rRNA (pseudouridine1915-N3)-methyltransferase
MLITVAHIGSRGGAKDSYATLAQVFLDRSRAMAECETMAFATEKALFEWLSKLKPKSTPLLILMDSRGRSLTSEEFAAWLAETRDRGTRHLVFAIGPADGWSEAARRSDSMKLSLGQFTMAHALARLVLAEQIYRAFTILSGHPYHGGH